MKRICAYFGKKYKARPNRSRYCSDVCKIKAYRWHKDKRKKTGVSLYYVVTHRTTVTQRYGQERTQ